MFRRTFFKRLAAAVAGLIGGAGAIAASGVQPPRRQRVDLKLFRLDNPKLREEATRQRLNSVIARTEVVPFKLVPPPKPEPIDWFDQRPGDLIVGVRPDGRVEAWTAEGEPHWAKHPKDGGWTETVKITALDRQYDDLYQAQALGGLGGYKAADFTV